MKEKKDYFKEKWKKGLKSDNLLVRYKSKQFIEILEDTKPLEEFDMDLFFRIIEKITILTEISN